MKYIVCYSGGHSSALVAIEAVRKCGKENVILLNHNISEEVEHNDIKRFKNEVADYLGIEITYANMEGWETKTPLRICKELGGFKFFNSPVLCTYHLKTKPFEKYLKENWADKKDEVTILYGFDANEKARIQRRATILGQQGYKTDYPLAFWERTIESTEEIENDKTEVSYTDEAVSIYFYFDVKNELITFNSRQAFGYNQFTNAFNELLNKTIPGYGFEIFLQKDEDVLQEKLKSFKRINKITAVVIPPNSNTKELEELRNGLSYISECQDANATKYKLELSDSNEDRGLNIQAKLIRDVVKAVSSGYGDLTANGVNERDKAIMMKSNKDAAYTNIINEKISKVEYNKESEDFIERFKKSKNK